MGATATIIGVADQAMEATEDAEKDMVLDVDMEATAEAVVTEDLAPVAMVVTEAAADMEGMDSVEAVDTEV